MAVKTNKKSGVTVKGTSSADSITNSGSNVTISAGKGNDTVWNTAYGDNSSINTGDGNDSVGSYGADHVTINGGTGNDTIRLYNYDEYTLIEYKSGDGNDVIEGFNETSTLKIGDGTGTYSTQKSGSDIIITVGKGKITLVGAASLSTLNINKRNSVNPIPVKGTSEADYIENTIDGASIQALGGNDTIHNGWHDNGINSTIDAGAGNDSILSNGYASNVSINSGKGNDTIENYSDKTTIDGGDGNDLIYLATSWSGSSFVTVNGGKGNDTVVVGSTDAEDNVIFYKTGDGNDLITGFHSTSTLSISGSYSTATSGSDVVVTVGKGKITLQNVFATTDKLHINDETISLTDTKVLKLTDGNDEVTNYRDSVTINAGKGNDSIDNYGDNVSINGDAGNDDIVNFTGGKNVTLNGGSGNDYIENWDDNAKVTLLGGAGNDELAHISSTNNATALMDGGTGDDYLYTSASKTTLIGGKGNDSLKLYTDDYSGTDNVLIKYTSGDGNDIITGFNETSTLSITGDSYSTQESGNDFIVTVGEDKITLVGAALLSTININESVFSGSGGTNSIVGTSGADSITNTIEGVTIKALGGDDYINNNAPDVSINAGAGNDTIDNDGWNVTIDAGKGHDLIYAGHDTLTVDAGDGNDSININSACYSSINGGSGDDYFIDDGSEYSSCYTTIVGGKGNDTMSLSGGYKTYEYKSGDGNDVIYNLDWTDTLSISGGSYSSVKSGKNIIVTVGKGKITLVGASGKGIKLVGISDNDNYIANTLISGTSKSDTINNFADNVTINTGAGKDLIWNVGSSALIYGEDGNDYILESDFNTLTATYTNPNKSSLDGGQGNDTIISYGNHVSITGGEGNDDLTAFGDKYATLIGGAGNDTIDNFAKYASIDAGDGNDVIYNSGDNVIFQYHVGDGNDIIDGFKENSTLSISGGTYSTKNNGDDIIVTVGKGKITLVGAASLGSININDNKLLIVTNSTKSPVTVDAETKIIDASTRTKAIKITGNGLDNTIIGGSKNDSLYGRAGNDSIVGNAGNDKLYGSNGDDTLVGGKGNDTLWGDAGNDKLYGGDGKDVFIYKPGEGTDTIFDYQSGDMLKILKSNGKGGGTFTNSSFKNNELTLAIDGGGKVIFDGVASGDKININGTNYKISGSKLQ